MTALPADVRLRQWLERHAQPYIGWPALVVALLLVWTAATAVQRAAWVDGLTGVQLIALSAFAISLLLAKLRVHPLPASMLTLLSGSSLIVLWLAVTSDNYATIREQLTQIIYRSGAWLVAVQNGDPSSETLPFAFLLLLFVWCAVAFLGWMLLRHQQPLVALVPLSIGMGFNAYLGNGSQWFVLLYAFAMLWLLLLTHSGVLMTRWRTTGVNFAYDIRQRMQQISWGVSLLLWVLAASLSGVRSIPVARAFVRWEPVQQAEAWLMRSFAGVNSRRQVLTSEQVEAGSVLPRSYLLGDAPELYETVVMTAQVEIDDVVIRPNIHWRSLSYDVYTGGGWARSDETMQPANANQPLTRAPQATSTVSQTVTWAFDNRLIKQTFGQPQQFDHATQPYTRLDNELVWVSSPQQTYQVFATVSRATSAELNQVTLSDIESDLLAHYTRLPDTLPKRVIELAQTLVTDEMTPFQQAQAIEAFVKQFPYSLAVDAPPRGRDPVDYFLFEQQSGYCDYYASAMVVLARSVGLPARMGIGYAPSAADANGVQTVRQIDGHSWAEIYFGAYGWIEFEPTAGFGRSGLGVGNSAEIESTNRSNGLDNGSDFGDFTPPPLPDSIPERQPMAGWLGMLLALLVILFIMMRWYRRQSLPSIEAQFAFLHRTAQQLNMPIGIAQTPIEFYTTWAQHIAQQQFNQRLARWFLKSDWRRETIVYADQITRAFEAQQYGAVRREIGVGNSAEWRQFQHTIWLLRRVVPK